VGAVPSRKTSSMPSLPGAGKRPVAGSMRATTMPAGWAKSEMVLVASAFVTKSTQMGRAVRRYDQWPPRRGGREHAAVANQMQLDIMGSIG
jgi:hypothetical protein